MNITFNWRKERLLLKCKNCSACHKGYFKSKPDDYVCTGVCEPFVIKNIDKECTEYPKKNKENTPIIVEKSWKEFRDSGFLWWVNMILHTFGWAITVEMEDDKVINAYPARVKFRGFGEKNNTEGYIKVSQYMKENVSELLEEAEN